MKFCKASFLFLLKKWAIFLLGLIALANCDAKKTHQDLRSVAALRKRLNQNAHTKPIPYKQSDPEQARQIVPRVGRHVLKNGETLQDLAMQYKTDQMSILRANGIENWDQIQPGQTILIPINEPLTE